MDLGTKVESLVEFRDKGVLNTTPEEEALKYGYYKTSAEEEEKKLLRGVAPEDRRVYLQDPDLVWDGWHAAFIESKEVKTTHMGKVNRVLGKRKLSVPAPLLSEQCKMSLDNWEDESEDESEDELEDSVEEVPTELRNEYAVAILAYEVFFQFWNWPEFKLMFRKEVYDSFVERLFEAAVKLVLSIFDMEDFRRICHRSDIRSQHTDFYRELFKKNDHHETISLLKSKFWNLWESDIYDGLHSFALCCEFKPLKPMWYNEMDPCYVSKASELMKKYVPLKANLKRQILLEHAERKCFHVTDALVLQAIHSLDLPSIIDECNNNEKRLNLLSELANAALLGFNGLSFAKAEELAFSVECVTAPVIYQFGPCEPEVVDVIKLANYMRRLSNARFIGEEHILSALSLSRVRNIIVNMKIDTELRYQGGGSELYTYELYRLSSLLAKEKAGVDKWGLEHLVFSYFFGSSKENLEKCFDEQSELFDNMRLCKSRCLVKRWRNIDVLMVLMEKRCRFGQDYTCKGLELVTKLHKEVESGNLQLPRDEKLFESN